MDAEVDSEIHATGGCGCGLRGWGWGHPVMGRVENPITIHRVVRVAGSFTAKAKARQMRDRFGNNQQRFVPCDRFCLCNGAAAGSSNQPQMGNISRRLARQQLFSPHLGCQVHPYLMKTKEKTLFHGHMLVVYTLLESTLYTYDTIPRIDLYPRHCQQLAWTRSSNHDSQTCRRSAAV